MLGRAPPRATPTTIATIDEAARRGDHAPSESGQAAGVADTRLSMSPTPPASAPHGAAAAVGPSPCLRLRVEMVLVPDGDPLLGRVREERAAVAALSFDYPAGAPP